MLKHTMVKEPSGLDTFESLAHERKTKTCKGIGIALVTDHLQLPLISSPVPPEVGGGGGWGVGTRDFK